ncbi:hypothetical protein EYF80_058806 [Liparis tanakae]|uniref:Uncharacterized protein n=1 Tax=Liparis tanakae TaxID=230148 RepID=A0A4Z2EQH3_9TELE|nr:hypothetical protein EYF80_058806 [Liparis tanakae]
MAVASLSCIEKYNHVTYLLRDRGAAAGDPAQRAAESPSLQRGSGKVAPPCGQPAALTTN